MAPLDTALALTQRDALAICIGEDLHFHVPRLVDAVLEVHAPVPECRLGALAGTLQGSLEVVLVVDALHPDAAATRRGFHEQWVADVFGLIARLLE